MIETARFLGSLSAILLLVAIAAGVRSFRNPLLQRLDGKTVFDFPHGETASRLLMSAVAFSAVAALLTIGGIFTS